MSSLQLTRNKSCILEFSRNYEIIRCYSKIGEEEVPPHSILIINDLSYMKNFSEICVPCISGSFCANNLKFNVSRKILCL